jgi:hypothetical protein
VTPGGPPPDAGGPLFFSYHRALAPMLWMFLAIAVAELLLVHFLVTLWHPRLAIFLSLLSFLGLLWLIGFIRSLRRYPVLIDEDEVRFRLGRLRDVGVPIARIGLVRLHWPPRWHKRFAVLNLALFNYPNIIVDLLEPLPGRRKCWAIAHRLDDPEGFARILRERIAAAKPPSGPPAWFA